MATHDLSIGLGLSHYLVGCGIVEASSRRFEGVELHLIFTCVLPEILEVLGDGIRGRVTHNLRAEDIIVSWIQTFLQRESIYLISVPKYFFPTACALAFRPSALTRLLAAASAANRLVFRLIMLKAG